MACACNPYGDGHACERIADVLEGKNTVPGYHNSKKRPICMTLKKKDELLLVMKRIIPILLLALVLSSCVLPEGKRIDIALFGGGGLYWGQGEREAKKFFPDNFEFYIDPVSGGHNYSFDTEVDELSAVVTVRFTSGVLGGELFDFNLSIMPGDADVCAAFMKAIEKKILDAASSLSVEPEITKRDGYEQINYDFGATGIVYEIKYKIDSGEINVRGNYLF